MTASQQDTALQRPETPMTPAADRNEPIPGYTDSPVQKAIAQAKRSLDTVHHQQATTTEGLQKLQVSIEKATLAGDAADPAKLATLYRKRRSFEERLNELAGEEEVHTRHLEQLTRQEQQARVEEAVERRKATQAEGLGIADVIRHTVGLLGNQVAELLELKNRERVCQDVLRSLAADRMQELPTFSYACAVDDNFQIALIDVIKECRRSAGDLQTRHTPLPAEMAERIAREQAR